MFSVSDTEKDVLWLIQRTLRQMTSCDFPNQVFVNLLRLASRDRLEFEAVNERYFTSSIRSKVDLKPTCGGVPLDSRTSDVDGDVEDRVGIGVAVDVAADVAVAVTVGIIVTVGVTIGVIVGVNVG